MAPALDAMRPATGARACPKFPGVGQPGHPHCNAPAPTPTLTPALASNLTEILLDDSVMTVLNGASHCMCGDASLFVNFYRCKPSPVGGIAAAKNVLLVKGLKTVLLSSSQLWDLHSVTSHFATLTRNSAVVATGTIVSLHPLELVHRDILTVDTASLPGKRYVVTFVYDFSRCLWVEPLNRKSGTFKVFKHFKVAAETGSGRKLQPFGSDNGGEYSSRAFCAYLDERGITFESPLPYSPSSNGITKQVNCSIPKGMRTMMHQAGAHKPLWAEALLAFAFIKNRSPHATLSKVPLSVWRDRSVRVDMLRNWGRRAWHTLALDDHAIPLVFVGYEGDTKVYRLLDPATKHIVLLRNARFQEDIFQLASPLPSTATPIVPDLPVAIVDDGPIQLTVYRIDTAPAMGPLVFQCGAAPSPESPDPLNFLSDLFIAQPVALMAAVDEDRGTHDAAFSLPSNDPRNHCESLIDIDSAGWLKGEFLSLLNVDKVCHPGDCSTVPPTAKILGGHFHYCRKGYGTTRALKGRVVAQGYNQCPGLDFREPFALLQHTAEQHSQ
ncbi:hypothetical protein JCM21900_006754 [Sporobolomyces salmonicolor]